MMKNLINNTRTKYPTLPIIIVLLVSLQCFSQHNVIVVIADDIGTDYFGFYDDYKDTVDVPTLRYLVQNGILFSNAAANPVCSSTRAGILTGRYSFRTGVGGIVGGEGGSNPLDTVENTIPRLLKKFNSGIGTANIGKWHLQQPMPMSNLRFPNVMGYDHFEGPFIGQLTSYTNWTKCTNGVNSTITKYATTENIDNAVNWIKSQKANPFFLWLAFNAPHDPIHLPPSNLHKYVLSGTQQDIRMNPKKYYKAMIQAMDTELGRLFDSLKILNRWDSTDIIFIGDNGNTPRTAQISDTSRAKGTIYQYGIHVPFIISGPSVRMKGTKTNALINTVDIFATVQELMGNTNWQSQIASEKPVDSKSILPIIKAEVNQIRPWSFSEIFKLEKDEKDGKCIQNENYKLMRFDDAHEELYNLDNDPNELSNLFNGQLSSEAQINNNYLCKQLYELVGSGISCTVIDEIPETINRRANIIVYPNPVTNKLNIKGNVEIIEFTLIDGLGKKVQVENIESAIDMCGMDKGLYYLQLRIANGIAVYKIIKI